MTGAWHQRPWLRRALFVSGNLLAVILITMGVVLPVRDFFADRDAQIIHQRETLARWRAIAAQEEAVRNIAGQVTADQGEFLGGKNEGVVQADLQTRLKGLAEKAGARLRSIRSVPSQTDQPTRYLGARIELYGTVQTVHRAVHAIENGKPYLFIKGAVMRLAPMSGQANASQEPSLEAQLDIFGVMPGEASER